MSVNVKKDVEIDAMTSSNSSCASSIHPLSCVVKITSSYSSLFADVPKKSILFNPKSKNSKIRLSSSVTLCNVAICVIEQKLLLTA